MFFKSTKVNFTLLLVLTFAFRANSQLAPCPGINSLSTKDFLAKLEPSVKDSCYNQVWMLNDQLRYQIIGRLDQIMDDVLDFRFYRLNKNYVDWKHADDHLYCGLSDSVALRNAAIDKDERDSLKLEVDTFAVSVCKKLIAVLQIDQNILDEPKIEANISTLYDQSTIRYLYTNYRDLIDEEKLYGVSNSVQNRNLNLIAARLSQVEESDYIHYKSYVSENKPLKAIDLYMDNELFAFFGGFNFNQDREYTGGGALTISTDHFKGRWINLGWIFGSSNKPSQAVMSYQSIRIGMNFFTPYIKYRNNLALADTMHLHDRPFGSYVYLERSKYRLWPNGLVRHQGEFQVGQIGSNVGRDIQATLHKDITLLSQKVYGWDKQVGNGGRLVYQVNHQFDFLLFSTTNKYKSLITPHKIRRPKKNVNNKKKYKYFGLNFIGSLKGMVGGYFTGGEYGFSISTLDFTNQSGQKAIRYRKDLDKKAGVYIELGFRHRYVHHNTMLEGPGIFGTWVDDQYDDEPTNYFVLNQAAYQAEIPNLERKQKYYTRLSSEIDQVERSIFLLDFKLNIRFRNMIFYLYQTFTTSEYNLPEIDNYTAPEIMAKIQKPEDQQYYRDIVIDDLQDFRSNKFYGYGRVGVTWLVGQ